MQLTQAQIQEFNDRGYLFIPQLFTPQEMGVLTREMAEVLKTPRRVLVLEKDGKTPRSLFNLHAFSEAYARLVRHPKIVGPARTLVGGPVYVFQLVVNFKAPFSGDQWPWHQDYPTYHHDDGMPRPAVVNCLIFMEDVGAWNGPLMLVPESHKETYPLPPIDTTKTSYPARWAEQGHIERTMRQNGIVAPQGPAGSVIFAHTNILHASGPNMSPWGRTLMSLTVNALDNQTRGSRRPDYIVPKDRTPLEPLAEDCLLALARETA
jgi:ectoine hydroxylase